MKARDLAKIVPREVDAPYRIWGDNLEATAVQQMKNACKLPVAVAGALMPDAHVGYGLPIGGVLATRNAVIPYAVGVDIACRMKLTVLDLPVNALADDQDAPDARARARDALRHRRLVQGAPPARRAWTPTGASRRVTARLKDQAWAQLGTSGSGNHFVEFGVLTVLDDAVGLARGRIPRAAQPLRQPRHRRADREHYSRLARELHPELPKELKHLAWLDLSTEAGQEYWAAMELMGRYAAANHALIHTHIARALGVEVLLDIENHHNFAWNERHRSPTGRRREVIVHRKGATPAGAGVLGIIPGSMATPGYVVRGKGVAASLNSASHGAGRRMSRTKAKESFTWDDAQRFLRERGVTLLSAGLDEVPMAYKDIDEVMAAQTRSRRAARAVRSAPREDGAERRAAGGLGSAWTITGRPAFDAETHVTDSLRPPLTRIGVESQGRPLGSCLR